MSEKRASPAAAPLRYEVEARVVAPDRSEGRRKRTSIRFDSSAGQSESLPGPAELLTLAFAACALKNVERFSKLLLFRTTMRGSASSPSADQPTSELPTHAAAREPA